MRHLIILAVLATCAPDVATTPERMPIGSVRVPSYDDVRGDIERQRRALAARHERGEHVIAEARTVVEKAVTEQLIVRWLGTPWAYHGVATSPGDEPIACGYFVAQILQDAGVRLQSRRQFGMAAALDIQRSLTPETRHMQRIFSVPATELRERIAQRGDGLYLIGLDIHVGFVLVKGDDVRLLHASYTGDAVVTDEPLVGAEAIERSRSKGYFVSKLFADDRAIVSWLLGREHAISPRASRG